MKQKMMNSKFGKILRRLVGEEAGAVMMEYVIIAVLIAAACVVAIAYFGRTVTTEANVATIAMTGKGMEAQTLQTAAQAKATKMSNDAVDANKPFSDATEEAAKSGSGSSGSGN